MASGHGQPAMGGAVAGGKAYVIPKQLVWEAYQRVLRHLNEALAAWVRRKYTRFRRQKRASRYWLARVARRDRNLFAHWRLGILPEAGV